MLRHDTWLQITIMTAFIIFLVGGCSTTEEIGPEAPAPPDWLKGEVIDSEKLCAVGASEPTFYIDDAQATAADNCRRQLAHTISTQITSVMIDTATERRNTVEEASVTETTASISEMVVENAEVLEYWLDSHGQMSDRKDITYALCCMPRAQ